MKITNFKLKSISEEKDDVYSILKWTVYIATVDVETGYLWWKKKHNVQVCKKDLFWFWMDSGEYTPNSVIDELYRSYEANEISKRLKERN